MLKSDNEIMKASNHYAVGASMCCEWFAKFQDILNSKIQITFSKTLQLQKWSIQRRRSTNNMWTCQKKLEVNQSTCLNDASEQMRYFSG